MGTVRYTVMDGELVSELRGGVKRDYLPDLLGSTIALLDSSQAKTDTFEYWPYGESAARTGSTATPFQYVGTAGYFNDSSSKSYVRARYLDKSKGRWVTEDPIGFDSGDWNLYRYCATNPLSGIDYSGLQTAKLDERQIRDICYKNKDKSSIGKDGGLGGVLSYYGTPIACNWYYGTSRCLRDAIDKHEGYHQRNAVCFSDNDVVECTAGKKIHELDECDAHHIGFKHLLGCCDKEVGAARSDCMKKGMKTACELGRTNCGALKLKWKFEQECRRRERTGWR